jgi:AcrR family transcriptional regulator
MRAVLAIKSSARTFCYRHRMAGQRAVARRAVLAQITEEGRRQLARDGAAALSVRSVARELDMASSAIYRYVDSRDQLLTMLIVAGYDRLGSALEGVGPDLVGRAQWTARGQALRTWAHANPHEYALLYGSPVPGYAAPEDTIGPATRVYAALARPMRASTLEPPPVDGSLADDDAGILATLELDLAPGAGLALLQAWAGLFGLVNLELFGHTHGVIGDHEAFFARQLAALADQLGLP